MLLALGSLAFEVTRSDILIRIPYLGEFYVSLLREGAAIAGRRFFFERWSDRMSHSRPLM